MTHKSTIAVLLLSALGLGFTPSSSSSQDISQDWITQEVSRATSDLLANVAPAGTARGVVLASPSRQNPDYYYHWVRDGSVVMDAIVTLYETSPKIHARGVYYADVMDFVDFSRRNQLTPNLSGGPNDTGLGEPKFNVDGTAFDQDWGRPQNDGPALRALALIHFANVLLDEGQESIVRQKLYDSKLPTQTVIKADAEYVAHHWRDSGFDLWEETKGMHFYTSVVQRKALLMSAALADRLGDSGAAGYYRVEAQSLQGEIDRHWDAGRGYFVATLDRVKGGEAKVSNLDSGVILGALQGCASDGMYCASSDQILATAAHLEDSFKQQYTINQMTRNPQGLSIGNAIGRYPEDVYDGTGTSRGNPWFILTNAFGQLAYEASAQFAQAGVIHVTALNLPYLSRVVSGGTALHTGDSLAKGDARFTAVVQGLHDAGDAYLRRTQYHMDVMGSLSEEMNRDNGYMQGAHDLSWSYASFLTAAWAR